MSEDDDIEQSVRTHGWHFIAVEPDEDTPPFSYTIGFAHTFAHPEVMIFGLDGRLAHSIASDMASRLKEGHPFSAGHTYSGLLDGYDVAVRPVHPTQHLLHLGYAIAFYRRLQKRDLLTAIQVFWPDKAGKFPFELECDPRAAARQPRMELAVPPSELKAFMDEFGSNS
jgi:hypothetical protein